MYYIKKKIYAYKTTQQPPNKQKSIQGVDQMKHTHLWLLKFRSSIRILHHKGQAKIFVVSSWYTVLFWGKKYQLASLWRKKENKVK